MVIVPDASQAYEERKAADPEFYRDANSLAYGKDPGDDAAAIDRMVGELNEQCAPSLPLHTTTDDRPGA